MTTATRKEFAEIIGVRPSYITKLGHEGRLVLTPDGKRVEVEATQEMIARTTGGRPDVASRHAAARGEAKAVPAMGRAGRAGKNAPKRENEGGENSDPERLVDAKTRKERAQADQEEMKAEQMRGNLVAKEDVDAAMKFVGGAIRAALEVMPDQLAPLVAPITDLAEVHELITQTCRDAIYSVGEAIKRQDEEIGKIKQ
jgi:phage terminase Nu1 subunit (DNA packaging protein)